MLAPDIHSYSFKSGEEAVLLHLFNNDKVDHIIDTCEESFFYDSFTKTVFRATKDLVLGVGGGHVDFLSVRNMLQAGGASEVGIRYLDELREKDIKEYPEILFVIEKLKGLSTRRQLISILHESLEKAQNTKEDVETLLSDTEDNLIRIETGEKKRLEMIFPHQLVERRHEGLVQRYMSKGIFTYWVEFDKHLSVGFAPGKLSIVGGRTSMGKSLFKSNLIRNMCTNGVSVLNVCPEQGFDSEHDRIDAIMTGVHLKTITQIRNLKLGDSTFGILGTNSEKIASNWKYVCVPSRNVTVSAVRSAIRRARRNGLKPDIVFVDLFDGLEDVNIGRDRTANMSFKLGQIKKIADEEQVHMCLLVQINRGPESRKDKRPSLGDLRECGSFEQDADIVLLLYREAYYDKSLPDTMLDVEIAKQRDGISGITYQFMIMDIHTLDIAPAGEKVLVSDDKRGN